MMPAGITPFQSYGAVCRVETQGFALVVLYIAEATAPPIASLPRVGATLWSAAIHRRFVSRRSRLFLISRGGRWTKKGRSATDESGDESPHSKTAGHRSTARRGAVLIMALVSLVLVVALTGTLLRWAAMEHKLIRSQQRLSQARWLAEAGIGRAAAQLAGNADYAGETWQVEAAQLPSGEEAQVRLKIARIEKRKPARSIEIDVEYGPAGRTPVRLHKEVVYQFSSGETP